MPNDTVAENARVKGIQTPAELDVVTAAAKGGKQSQNTEKLQPVPSGPSMSGQPSKTKKNRGPGYCDQPSHCGL